MTADTFKQAIDAIRIPALTDGSASFFAGEIVRTASSRLTTPFPPFDLSTGRKAANSISRTHEWLRYNTELEATARQNTTLAKVYAATQIKNLSPSDIDEMNMYLFDRELVLAERSAPRSIFSNLTATEEWEDPTANQDLWLLRVEINVTPSAAMGAFGTAKAARKAAVDMGYQNFEIDRIKWDR